MDICNGTDVISITDGGFGVCMGDGVVIVVQEGDGGPQSVALSHHDLEKLLDAC